MPLILHRSADPDRLAAEAARVLAEPPANPLALDLIAVHSRGVEQWLSMQIAQHNRIFGAARFVRPEDLVATLAAEALGETLAVTWSKGELLWALLAELPALLDQPRLEPVRAYVEAEGETERTLRLVALCQRLATVFQAYGSYRPALVRAWQVERDLEPWEAPLWRAVERRLGPTHLTGWADRLAGHTLPARGGRTLLFTVTTLPPLALKLVADLAGEQPIHIFALHPSPAAWERNQPAHPLLASMGTLAQDFRTVAADTPSEHHLLDIAPPERDSLLHALQADLHDDTLRACTPPADDQSVQLHICTSPLRQVQTLRDTLLHLLDDPTLQPRDIVVMTPDVEVYAPLVQAVFRDGSDRWDEHPDHPGGFPALPFRLADRGVRAQNPAAEALLGLLELVDARLDAPDVLAFLSLQPVRERFGLSAEALPRVRELVAAAGARWGADADHRLREDLPPDDRFTWRFAIDRLLLGQALSEPEHAMLLGHAPACDLESLDDRHILGGLVDFLETLLAQVDALQHERPPSAWFQQLVRAVDALASPEAERSWQVLQVTAVLEELHQQAQASGFDTPVDLRTVRALVTDRFEAREPGQGFLAGSITVCQLVPLRSVPFRVVCLLGMDENSFPRIQSRPGYDRMALEPQPGDRNARIDDRALFLEAIQSARQTLVITCTGRSEQSGTELPLSVPVAELLDTVRSMAGADAVKKLTTRHALQPWSPARFSGAARSFDRRMQQAASAWQQGRHAPAPVPTRFADPLPTAEPPEALSLAHFVRFFKHPPSELVRRRLGLSLYRDETELTGALPFDVDALQAWQLKQALLDERIAPTSPPGPSFGDRARRGAVVPMGTPGQLLIEDLQASIEPLLARARSLLAEPRAPIDVHLPGAPVITGRIQGLYASGRVVLQPGRVHPRQVLQLWIEHLALHGMGWTGTSTLLGPHGGRSLHPLDPDVATAALEDLRALFHQGLAAPLLFWPDPSYQAHQAEGEGPMAPFYKSKMYWNQRKDAQREVDQWVLGSGTNPFLPHYRSEGLAPPLQVARAVWAPVLPHLEDSA